MNSNNTFFNDSSIKAAAIAELNMISRTSFSENGFSSAQRDAIANAIAAGIQAYEEQRHS